MRSLLARGILLLGALFAASAVQAQTCTAASSGTWFLAARWTCTAPIGNRIPLNTDAVTIGNFAITVDAPGAVAASVSLNSGNANGSLTINAGSSLAVGGNVNLNASTLAGNTRAKTITVAGTLTAGSFTLAGVGTNTRQAQLVINNGTVTVTGAFAVTANVDSLLLFCTAASTTTACGATAGGTLNLGSTFGNGAQFNAGTGTVNYNGTAAQTVATYTYSTLKSNNTAGASLGVATTATNLTVGDVTANSLFSDAGFVLTSVGTLNLTSGTLRLGSAGTATAFPGFATRNIAAGTTVEYAAGVAQAVSAVPAYQNLTFSGAGAKTTAAGTLSIGGNWSVTGGAATLNTNNTIVSLTGNLSGTGNITQGTGTISIGGNWTNTGTFSAPANSTVDYNGGAAQSVSVGPSYQNLTFSGAGTKTTAAGTLSVAGNWSVSSATALNTNNTTVNVTGNLTGTGSITQGSNLITLAGDWTNTGTFTASSAGVTLTGSAKQVTGPAAGISFTTLTVNGTYTNNNTSTGITASTALSGTGTLTQGTNAVLTIGGTSGITTLTATANPNTVVYNGSAAQTVKATTYHHLTANNSNASGVSIAANVTINGTLTLQQGIFSTGANTLITAANCASSVSRPGGTPGHVVGRLQKTIPTGASACTFEVGTSAAAYTPIVTSYAGVTTGGNVLGYATTGEHPSISSSGIDSTRSVNRYWTLTTPVTGSLPSGGTYSATFNFLAGDIDGGAATATFIVARYSGSWAGTTAGTRAATSTQATGLSAYGDFAIGEAALANFAREKQFIFTREQF